MSTMVDGMARTLKGQRKYLEGAFDDIKLRGEVEVLRQNYSQALEELESLS